MDDDQRQEERNVVGWVAFDGAEIARRGEGGRGESEGEGGFTLCVVWCVKT